MDVSRSRSESSSEQEFPSSSSITPKKATYKTKEIFGEEISKHAPQPSLGDKKYDYKKGASGQEIQKVAKVFRDSEEESLSIDGQIEELIQDQKENRLQRFDSKLEDLITDIAAEQMTKDILEKIFNSFNSSDSATKIVYFRIVHALLTAAVKKPSFFFSLKGPLFGTFTSILTFSKSIRRDRALAAEGKRCQELAALTSQKIPSFLPLLEAQKDKVAHRLKELEQKGLSTIFPPKLREEHCFTPNKGKKVIEISSLSVDEQKKMLESWVQQKIWNDAAVILLLLPTNDPSLQKIAHKVCSKLLNEAKKTLIETPDKIPSSAGLCIQYAQDLINKFSFNADQELVDSLLYLQVDCSARIRNIIDENIIPEEDSYPKKLAALIDLVKSIPSLEENSKIRSMLADEIKQYTASDPKFITLKKWMEEVPIDEKSVRESASQLQLINELIRQDPTRASLLTKWAEGAHISPANIAVLEFARGNPAEIGRLAALYIEFTKLTPELRKVPSTPIASSITSSNAQPIHVIPIITQKPIDQGAIANLQSSLGQLTTLSDLQVSNIDKIHPSSFKNFFAIDPSTQKLSVDQKKISSLLTHFDTLTPPEKKAIFIVIFRLLLEVEKQDPKNSFTPSSPLFGMFGQLIRFIEKVEGETALKLPSLQKRVTECLALAARHLTNPPLTASESVEQICQNLQFGSNFALTYGWAVKESKALQKRSHELFFDAILLKIQDPQTDNREMLNLIHFLVELAKHNDLANPPSLEKKLNEAVKALQTRSMVLSARLQKEIAASKDYNTTPITAPKIVKVDAIGLRKRLARLHEGTLSKPERGELIKNIALTCRFQTISHLKLLKASEFYSTGKKIHLDAIDSVGKDLTLLVNLLLFISPTKSENPEKMIRTNFSFLLDLAETMGEMGDFGNLSFIVNKLRALPEEYLIAVGPKLIEQLKKFDEIIDSHGRENKVAYESYKKSPAAQEYPPLPHPATLTFPFTKEEAPQGDNYIYDHFISGKKIDGRPNGWVFQHAAIESLSDSVKSVPMTMLPSFFFVDLTGFVEEASKQIPSSSLVSSDDAIKIFTSFLTNPERTSKVSLSTVYKEIVHAKKVSEKTINSLFNRLTLEAAKLLIDPTAITTKIDEILNLYQAIQNNKYYADLLKEDASKKKIISFETMLISSSAKLENLLHMAQSLQKMKLQLTQRGQEVLMMKLIQATLATEDKKAFFDAQKILSSMPKDSVAQQDDWMKKIEKKRTDFIQQSESDESE